MTTVHGRAVSVSPEQYAEPALRAHVEATAVEALRAERGGDPHVVGWRHEAADTWQDPATGEVLDLPERWVLLAEVAIP